MASVSSGPSDTVLVRSTEVRTSSSYRDSSGSISSVEGSSSHPETKNCSSPEPERRLCFHISLVGILGTSWYRFFCWGKTSNRRRNKKNKDHRCLQAEAEQSGPWIRRVQCAELQMMQRYTVFDIALMMHHTRLTGRQRNRRKVRINRHTLLLPQFKMVLVQQPYKSTTPPPPPRAPQPCLDVSVEKTLFFFGGKNENVHTFEKWEVSSKTIR